MSSVSFKQERTKGITLIELIVVMAIIAILVAVVIFDFVAQRDRTILNTATNDIVGVLRQSQSYATAVREHDGSFDVGYGVRFRRNTQEVRLFVDEDKDGQLGGEDLIEEFVLARGASIDDISTNSNIDIVFIRPSVTPTITEPDGTTHQSVTITVASPGGRTSNIVINTAGQIAVE